MYVDVVGALDPTRPIDPELLARVHELAEAGRHEDAGKLIPDEVLDRFALAGTPDQVAERAAELFAAGAARVDFGPPLSLDGPLKGIGLLVRRVLPALR
jgi:5,10-methylenetetrahydromethanopterin reductase